MLIKWKNKLINLALLIISLFLMNAHSSEVATLSKKNMEVSPLSKNVNNQTVLMQKSISPVKSKTHNKTNITELTYPHDIKVILKPTNFHNSEIVMEAFRSGGSSLYSNEDFFEAKIISHIVNRSKTIQQSEVNVSTHINGFYEKLTGRSDNNNLELMFQLIHSYFTQPPFEQKTANKIIEKHKERLTLVKNSPDLLFRLEYPKLAYNNHFRTHQATSKQLNDFDFNRAKAIYKERFGDTNNFTFVFVGSFNIQKIEPLINQYIATLSNPKKTKNTHWLDTGIRPSAGVIKKNLYKGETQKSSLIMQFNHKAPYETKTRQEHKLMSKILAQLLSKTLSKELMSTYSPRAGSFITQEPESFYHTYIQVSSNPKDLNKVIDVIMREINSFKQKNISKNILNDTKKTALKRLERRLTTNRFWSNNLVFSYKYGLDVNSINKISHNIKQITLKDIKRAANQYLNTDWYSLITLSPEEQ